MFFIGRFVLEGIHVPPSPLPYPEGRGGLRVQTGNIGNKTNREHGLHKLWYEQGGLAYALERDLCDGFEDAVDR